MSDSPIPAVTEKTNSPRLLIGRSRPRRQRRRTLRHTTPLSITVLAAVIATASACTSQTAGEPTAGSASATGDNSPAFPSESVPPGVQKDSVLDLNSTKDMTGVATTVSFADSPYAAHLPDICTYIPDSVMQQLGVQTKKRGFRGTQLVTQSCVMLKRGSIKTNYSVTVNFYTNNFAEISNPARTNTFQTGVQIGPKVVAATQRLKPLGPDDLAVENVCGTAWGTFFGSIVVNYRASDPPDPQPCSQSIAAAKLIVPLMPRSPSQMRPAP